MNRISAYIQEAYTELVHKVTWPTWGELQNSAVVVLVATIIIALVVLAMDEVSSVALRNLYDILS